MRCDEAGVAERAGLKAQRASNASAEEADRSDITFQEYGKRTGHH